MQPDSVIIYDNHLYPHVIKGGIVDLSPQEFYTPKEIEIVPYMKVVYNEITGDIDNIYYVDRHCGGYTIHGEQAHMP